MAVGVEKELDGPFETKIKFSFSAATVLALLFAFVRWQRPAMGLIYAFIDFFTIQRWAILFFGTTLVAAGFLLSARVPAFRMGRRSFAPASMVLIGLASLALALLAPLLQSAPRWAGPSVAMIQVDNASKLRGPIGDLVDKLTISLGTPVEFSRVVAPETDIVEALKSVRRLQHDVVILDYDTPLQLGSDRFAELLNPRTVYVLTRPGDPEQRLPPNVLSLSPPIVEEVYALAKLVGSPTKTVQILRSDTPRARLAASLLRYALTTRSLSVAPDSERDLKDMTLANDEVAVWIGWRPAALPDGTELRAPSVISVDANDGLVLRSGKALPYLSHQIASGVGWHQNQLLALGAIVDAHFVKTDRPLDTRVSVEAAVDQLARLHLATVSHDMRLIPRYSELRGTP